MTLDYDTWLLRGSGIDDDGPAQDAEFFIKFRGGIAKVFAESSLEGDCDDGKYYEEWQAKIVGMHWAFSEEFEIDFKSLTMQEENEIESKAREELFEV